MTHFGVICPPVAGHIDPFSALGRELIARGHRVTFFQMVDLEERIRSEGIDFRPIGLSDHPRGSLPQSLARLAQLKGIPALLFTIRAVERTTVMVCRDAPDALREARVDALLVDQMEPAGGAVAEHLDLPFITICNALPINRDRAVPPPFTGWRYRDRWWSKARNDAGYAVSDWLTSPVTRAVATYRRQWKLPILRSNDESFSPLAQISQMPHELDFPRRTLPKTFHYVGPLRSAKPTAAKFPWDRLDGRPLVYASLGTLQNRRESLFRCFADACRPLDVQLVISHGGGLTRAAEAALPGNPLVVDYAPQLDLLKRARLTLSHGGLNTVLDSLANNVPLIVIPLTYEQPAIARRVEWSGAGCSLSLAALNPTTLSHVIHRALHDTRYADAARRLGDGIRRAGGVTRAAGVIESVLTRSDRHANRAHVPFGPLSV